MIRRVLVVAGLLLVGLTSGCARRHPVAAFPLGTAHRDLTYCNSQGLDLYIPRKPADRRLPVAMYVHGGGMTSGDKSNLNPILLDALASDGYAVASIDYRLAPDSRFPTQIEDVKCAIRYLRANAARYGLDGKVFAFGTSVGGQLVALAALTEPYSAWDIGPYPSEPSNLAAVADISGPANLNERASGYTPSGMQDVFGRKTNDLDLVLASPTHYVTPNSPPILLVQGVNDMTVLPSQSIELYWDLQAAGDKTQLVLVQNMGHRLAQVSGKPIQPSLQEIANDIVNFFNDAQDS
jgi:acetyl esterase/lipase